MTIHVTQDDISRGLKNDCCRCPIALAIEPFGRRLFVNEYSISYDRFEEYGIELPKIAVQFIEDFDDYKPVKPFSFNLSAECFMP